MADERMNFPSKEALRAHYRALGFTEVSAAAVEPRGFALGALQALRELLARILALYRLSLRKPGQ